MIDKMANPGRIFETTARGDDPETETSQGPITMRRSTTYDYNMGKILTIIIGTAFGFVGGALAGNLLVGLTTNWVEKAVLGAFAGAMCGVVGGSLGGDLSRQSAKDSSRTVYGIVFGGIAGALAAVQTESLFAALRIATYDLIR